MSAGGEEEAEHADERWLITYADMITLLMVLFIVLFSMSQVDLAKYAKLKQSLSSGFGKSVLEGGDGALDGAAAPAAVPSLAPSATDPQLAVATERAALGRARDELVGALAGAGLGDIVSLRVEERGLVVSVAADRVLFDPGQAALRPEGRAVMDRVAPALLRLPNHVSVEGHTDDVPISGTYPSNWELSTARASSVLRELIDRNGFAPDRMSAAGYADQRAVSPNTTPAGRAANRRVEIVVLAEAAPIAQAAPPVTAAPTTATPTTAAPKTTTPHH
jgi:chemotaxis protein MotB